MSKISIEVAFAMPEKQWLRALKIASSKSAGAAIDECGVREAFPEFDFDACAIGIWGREIDRSALLRDGDRIEVYRALELDPREARRQLALAGKTMRGANEDNGLS
jgi:putative ubiquitin-RnfH superfamily antitoxin RatB of RatAB toxin-antitoxin module